MSKATAPPLPRACPGPRRDPKKNRNHQAAQFEDRMPAQVNHYPEMHGCIEKGRRAARQRIESPLLPRSDTTLMLSPLLKDLPTPECDARCSPQMHCGLAAA